MPTIKVSVSVEVEGENVPGFPLVRRLQIDEVQPFIVERQTGGGYVSVPATDLTEVQALILQTDKPVTLRLNGQSDAGLPINAGGLVLVLDAAVSAALVSNSGPAMTTIRGVAAGT